MFPLGAVLVPGQLLPLRVFEQRYRVMIERCLARDGRFGVVMIARGSETGGGDVRTEIGTIAQIDQYVRRSGGQFTLVCRGTERICVNRWFPDDPHPVADVDIWPDEPQGPADPTHVLDQRAHIERLTAELASRKGAKVQRWPKLNLPADPSESSYALTESLSLSDADRHRALSAAGPADRLMELSSALDDVIAGLQFRLQSR